MGNNVSMDNIKKLDEAIEIFNNQEWYRAHDLFEEIWHNTNGKERVTIQAILQIAVAEVHLSNGNQTGATILFGEGLGRLKHNDPPSLGLDLNILSKNIEERLLNLQKGLPLAKDSAPFLLKKNINS